MSQINIDQGRMSTSLYISHVNEYTERNQGLVGRYFKITPGTSMEYKLYSSKDRNEAYS